MIPKVVRQHQEDENTVLFEEEKNVPLLLGQEIATSGMNVSQQSIIKKQQEEQAQRRRLRRRTIRWSDEFGDNLTKVKYFTKTNDHDVSMIVMDNIQKTEG